MLKTLKKARQITDHFQRFRELPKARPRPADDEQVSWDLGHFEGRFQDLALLDNSLEDYDPRPNHVLVNRDPFSEEAMAAEYHGSVGKGQIKLVLFGGDRYTEDYFFADGQFVDMLSARCYSEDGSWTFEARHIDRFSVHNNTEQCLRIQGRQ